MTPEVHTAYSLFLFCALAGLQHWLNRKHRQSGQFREGLAVASTSLDSKRH
jgi:hypothetical protein